MATDVIASNVTPGDDTLAGIFSGIATSVQNMTNQWAALQAQNDDIEKGRWTLNNVAFQFKELPTVSQALLLAAAVWLVLRMTKGA